MYTFAGHEKPWCRRLDHLICEVPDIDEALDVWLGLGFPLAWPVGRFWPSGRTAGVALGGINLEFVQPDESAPSCATIRTLAFEPIDLDLAAAALAGQGISVEVFDKWESDPALLRLRGFDAAESQSPQLICRNAYPTEEPAFPFFFCAYSPPLAKRLAPFSFPDLHPVTHVMVATPNPAADWRRIDDLFGLPKAARGTEIVLSEAPSEYAEVVEIRSDRGPLDFGKWPARFRLV